VEVEGGDGQRDAHSDHGDEGPDGPTEAVAQGTPQHPDDRPDEWPQEGVGRAQGQQGLVEVLSQDRLRPVGVLDEEPELRGEP